MRNNRRAGFTLIEVMVVLLIAAIVFAVLVSVMGSSFEILRAGESKAKLTANARTLIDYIANDLQSAAYIPLSSDRNLNGVPDEKDDPTNPGPHWRVADLDAKRVPYIDSSYYLSEAWSDRIQARHFNSAFDDLFSTGFLPGGLGGESRSVPRVISSAGQDRAAQWISFFRVAVPANNKMPYEMAAEADRNGDGIVDPENTGVPFGVINGYPEQVAVGPHKETAVAIADYWYALAGSQQYQRIRQVPVASNITRLRFEYFQQVPLYATRVQGGNLQLLAQDSTDGSTSWIPTGSSRTANKIPQIDHWAQVPVDVSYDASNSPSGFWIDAATSLKYAGNHYRLQDQYPESAVTPAVLQPGLNTWNCTAFYNIDMDGNGTGDNAPVDRFAYVTTSLSNGLPVEGGIAQIRPDMEALHGSTYWNYSINPTGFGDLGDADGIPDGDGQPDDPVPGWWLPYVRAIRVTVVATPTSVIDLRIAKSGQVGKTGSVVYYRLDSPVPYADAQRIEPLYNQKRDYIGPGSDLVLTKTVPVNFAYKLTPITDPRSTQLDSGGLRRVDINYAQAEQKLSSDPISYDNQIIAIDPYQKMIERDPSKLP